MSETKIAPERYRQLMQEIRLLDKLRWNYTDIKDFFHCCASRGVAIKKAAIKAGGTFDFDPGHVSSRTVLKLYATNAELEKFIRMVELSPLANYPEANAKLAEFKQEVDALREEKKALQKQIGRLRDEKESLERILEGNLR